MARRKKTVEDYRRENSELRKKWAFEVRDLEQDVRALKAELEDMRQLLEAEREKGEALASEKADTERKAVAVMADFKQSEAHAADLEQEVASWKHKNERVLADRDKAVHACGQVRAAMADAFEALGRGLTSGVKE